jgi:hypothetical protein
MNKAEIKKKHQDFEDQVLEALVAEVLEALVAEVLEALVAEVLEATSYSLFSRFFGAVPHSYLIGTG